MNISLADAAELAGTALSLSADLREAIAELRWVADVCDDWAKQSRGGWSTHQVDANVDTANRLRRKAAELERKLPEKLRGE